MKNREFFTLVNTGYIFLNEQGEKRICIFIIVKPGAYPEKPSTYTLFIDTYKESHGVQDIDRYESEDPYRLLDLCKGTLAHHKLLYGQPINAPEIDQLATFSLDSNL